MSSLQSNLILDLAGPGTGPLHARLAGALRQAIRDGRLPAGGLLPPSRVLAAELGCSRWVVTEAYAQLATAGYADGRTGSGTRVRAIEAELPVTAAGARAAAPAVLDMAPGLPDLRAFPVSRWAAAVRSAAAAISAADLGHPDPAGHPSLRAVIAEYLARARAADPARAGITICPRTTEGLGRVCWALRRAGCRAVAVEDPCWHRVREVVTRSGLGLVPVPVDAQGIEAGRLSDLADVGAVIVTPAHQFPSGVVLSAARRATLLGWARATGGVIVEDDYDAEFRYDGRPAGTLQGADPARVVLLGSVSKTLSPALGIGWIVAPPQWSDALRDPAAGFAPPPVLDQLAFAAFVRAGSYDRHLRAARKRYRSRRDNLVRELAGQLPGARVEGIAAGLHLVLRIDGGPGAVRAAALSRGVRVAELSSYAVSGESGLVLGYGNLPDQHIETAVRTLAEALAQGRWTRS